MGQERRDEHNACMHIYVHNEVYKSVYTYVHACLLFLVCIF